jgi:threonine synthase
LKGLFADRSASAPFNITSINSINVSRILAQITYYFASYFALIRSDRFNPSSDLIKFAVPTGNFGDVLAGFFAKRMGLPISELIIATNENDILYRFWQTGAYEKFPDSGTKDHNAAAVVKETMSPAMDIIVSSNFERLLWFLAYDVEPSEDKRRVACQKVKEWQTALKSEGRFSVEQKVLEAARNEFSSTRVSDAETLATIQDVYQWANVGSSGSKPYVLDPHSAISVTAAVRSAEAAPKFHCVALSTAHPAKFSYAVELALQKEEGFQFKDILPPQLSGLDGLPRRVIHVRRSDGLDGIRKVIMEEVGKE